MLKNDCEGVGDRGRDASFRGPRRSGPHPAPAPPSASQSAAVAKVGLPRAGGARGLPRSQESRSEAFAPVSRPQPAAPWGLRAVVGGPRLLLRPISEREGARHLPVPTPAACPPPFLPAAPPSLGRSDSPRPHHGHVPGWKALPLSPPDRLRTRELPPLEGAENTPPPDTIRARLRHEDGLTNTLTCRVCPTVT